MAFVLISKLYRQMYANTGIATDSVLHPLLERGLHVERVGARSTAAMSHAGRHEQPVEALDLARRLASIVLAAKEREHALVVVDAVLRRDQLIDPPVVLNQFATSLLERAEVGIRGVQDRRELRFGLHVRLVVGRIGERERPPVPIGIREHQPLVVGDGNRKRIGGIAVGPERLAARREARIELCPVLGSFRP